ncbi:MAG: ABC-2 transporter permease [Lachnospiraceae bacterium]|nr:ABC-2 transporter permease [Lachnospiraceae bacterium]
MKGLFVKDLKLMSGQKKSVFLVFLIACMLMATNSAMFVGNYLMIFCSMLVISTISYDEFDNGNAFLFTLPISRKQYVREKYIFGLGVCMVVCFITTLVIVGYQSVVVEHYNWVEGIISSVSGIFVSGFLLSFMIPLQLKFGSEKGRQVLIGISGIIGVICFVAVGTAKKFDIAIDELSNWLDAIHPGAVAAGFVGVVLVMIVISYLISVRVMEKKEF